MKPEDLPKFVNIIIDGEDFRAVTVEGVYYRWVPGTDTWVLVGCENCKALQVEFDKAIEVLREIKATETYIPAKIWRKLSAVLEEVK